MTLQHFRTHDFDLVDLSLIVPPLILDIKYATPHNFIGEKIYEWKACFLRKPVALKIERIQQELVKQHLSLKIWDAYRPLHVQKLLWSKVPDVRYVASPFSGSNHNRGAAVDCTLVTLEGEELEMGTHFDDFTRRSHRSYSQLSQKAYANRKMLEAVMIEHGFIPFENEWWHFDDEKWVDYSLLDISFAELK